MGAADTERARSGCRASGRRRPVLANGFAGRVWLPQYHAPALAGTAADSCLCSVWFFLGLLAGRLGPPGEVVDFLREAAAAADRAGALPGLAPCLQAAVEALGLLQAAADRQPAATQGQARAVRGRPGGSGLPDPGSCAEGSWSLRRDGQDWLLEAGPERTRLPDCAGLHHLRALLANPGTEIPALDLAAGHPGLAAAPAGPLLDATARNAYRSRIAQLDAQLDAADRVGDSATAGRAEAERRALVGELRRAAGLAGRPRRAGIEAERARVNVTRTLRAAIGRIAAAAPIAGAHLQACVRTGTACRYQPAPGGPAGWRT